MHGTKSIHEDLGNKLLSKERDYKLDKLEEREGIVEKLSSRMEMEVKAYVCQTNSYLFCNSFLMTTII